jgi:single-strand DNA-binding protein
MADCTITVCGNLTRDPEMRFTTGGKGQVLFGIAVARRYQQDGQWKEQTSFFNVMAWERLAENVAASCVKGTRVIVTGRLEQRSYETKDGEKKQIHEIIADEIGTSLKWDPVEVQRAERESPSRSKNQDPAYGDEEPF